MDPNSKQWTARKKYWDGFCPSWISFLKDAGLSDEAAYPPLVIEDSVPIP